MILVDPCGGGLGDWGLDIIAGVRLFCPECGGAIAAEDIDLDKLLAKCRSCNNVFGFRQSVSDEEARGENRLPPGAVRTIPGRPPKMVVDDGGGTWSVRWRWFTPGVFVLLFFCIAWDSFLFFWYSVAVGHDAPWIAVVFPIGHVAVGVGLTYVVVATFVNSTVIELAGGQLSIRHGPLPWFGDRTVLADDIAQVFCAENWSKATQDRSSTRSFDLSAVLKDSTRVKLCGGFKTPDEPKYLEYELERQLRIVPQPVGGEFRY